MQQFSSSSLPPVSSSSTNLLSFSYFADKESVQYYYQYPTENGDKNLDEQIIECEQCFLSELKKLYDNKLASLVLDSIKKEFGDLTKLCKLIANGDVNRQQLEHILYSMLFDSAKNINKSTESPKYNIEENHFSSYSDYQDGKQSSSSSLSVYDEEEKEYSPSYHQKQKLDYDNEYGYQSNGHSYDKNSGYQENYKVKDDKDDRKKSYEKEDNREKSYDNDKRYYKYYYQKNA
jgi:hypothetical protein